MKQNLNGFTLTELMLVLFILAVITAFAVPAMIKTIPDYKLKKAALALCCDLHMAKSTAVLTKERVRVAFDSNTDTYRIEVIKAGKDLSKNNTPNSVIKKSVKLSGYGGGVKFGGGSATKSVSGNPIPDDFISYKSSNSLYFEINGLVSTLGYVYLTSQNNSTCYAVGTPSLAGIIRIYKTTGSNSKWVSY